MNLSKLFEFQRKLDQHIIKEKGLEGQYLVPQKTLALQVELGELANEWRGFKFWSEEQEPRTEAVRKRTTEEGRLLNQWESYNPMLEEYVDCLHFILTIGLDSGTDMAIINSNIKGHDITTQFNDIFDAISRFSSNRELYLYFALLKLFIGLGEMLGFTWEQIENAYMEKNKINHKRQENGY